MRNIVGFKFAERKYIHTCRIRSIKNLSGIIKKKINSITKTINGKSILFPQKFQSAMKFPLERIF